MRRVKILWVSGQIMLSICARGLDGRRARVTANPLPDDAVIVDVRFRYPNTVGLVIESESFPLVDLIAEGADAIPECPSPVLTEVTTSDGA